MKSNKGITLSALVITIIVTLILATTATYIGYDAIQTSAEQRFLSVLKQVNEAVNLHSQDYESLELVILNPEENYEGVTYKYKLETKEDYEKIGLADIEDIIYVNFDTGQIYSKNGINGKHTLKDFGVEYYKPTKEIISEENNVTFEINLEPLEYSWKYIIDNEQITCNGNPENGNLLYSSYSEDGNYNWKRVPKVENGYELETKEPGVYQFKFRDDTGVESEIKQVYSYIKDGLEVYYDGEYNQNYTHNEEASIWQDLSGNNNNANITDTAWEEKNLNLDGITNTLYCDPLNYEEATIECVEQKDNITSISNINKITTSNSNFDIGKYLNNNTSSYYKGKIYLFRVYNRALSEDEIATNYKIDQIRFGEISKE